MSFNYILDSKSLKRTQNIQFFINYFRVESISSVGFKLKKAQLEINSKNSSYFEFPDFESSYAYAYTADKKNFY